ncbi:hypothetical protein HYT51_00345 [Candidatus Woesearchaeota archaeon]|nr:hypothetical protein [Candidatus Woesearchaeota archaeon]
MDKRETFLKIYSNLALNLREEIILVIDKKPITWNVAYLEIKNNTKMGEKILSKLAQLKIL